MAISAAIPASGIENYLVSTEIKVDTGATWVFRLGGIIQVNGTRYGLTVGHPFAKTQSRNQHKNDDAHNMLEYHDSSDSEGSDLEESLFKPNHASFFNASVPVRGKAHTLFNNVGPSYSPSPPSSVSSPIERSPVSMDVQTTSQFITIGYLAALSGTHPDTGSSSSYDWALIELRQQDSALSNSYYESVSGHSINIQEIWQEFIPPMTEVLVLATPTHHLKGVIGQSNVSLEVDGWNIAATQIVIDSPLGMLLALSQVIRLLADIKYFVQLVATQDVG
ncbi:hypothetical protein LTR99_004950 [Exophiala xenobiotica]|uniref:Uncharacterized protein n=1 Tax=Vermiconidia calcicola TaxID=1690605 RepID=A0AAV9QCA3_9PEZI|nr:hypothetical protein LTR92_000694 [Exophiala xenobiotica]KAK5536401.1 hypothetical protein LTR23_007980 [Chaetothyriales sp. CCFEE 6169]KAK5540229.1 hypothetical protein LTR25_003935 [Vermiconidia calcicola]KAK5242921.1 hypothetical protein LTS06_011189 [Exophiala xenobiotica]KAK5259882.1 hypothetical protein LTR40_005149 [Exophiala xenobiotica]